MTRTFSKIYGLGGLRLGWAYCPKDIAGVLNRMRGPFNVSAPAMAAGVAALDDTDFTDNARKHNETWRTWTGERLSDLGLEVTPSAGNFVLVRFSAEPGRDAEAADGFLKDRGIIVRRMEAYGLGDCLRITIGQENEMRTLVDALVAFRE
jgi:histidinol-phosphate aminotransferase